MSSNFLDMGFCDGSRRELGLGGCEQEKWSGAGMVAPQTQVRSTKTANNEAQRFLKSKLCFEEDCTMCVHGRQRRAMAQM